MSDTMIPTDEDRAVFGRVADVLIPAYKAMPSATEVGVHGAMLDDVLRFRPDIVEAFRRGLSKLGGLDARDGANVLYRDDREAFNAVSLAASAGYYMTPRVRDLIGYPGQENVPSDAHATPDYLTDGKLERVVRRGPIYRLAPRA
jgi:hypothetical protein